MSYKNRQRSKPQPIETVNRHNNHDKITYPELMLEKERERALRKRRPIFGDPALGEE